MRVLAVVVVMFLSGGCFFPSQPYSPAAMTVVDGEFLVSFGCERDLSEISIQAYLVDEDPFSPPVGEWKAVPAGGGSATLSEFTAGVAPEGWEVVEDGVDWSLLSPWDDDTAYLVDVEGVLAGRVYSYGGSLDPGEGLGGWVFDVSDEDGESWEAYQEWLTTASSSDLGAGVCDVVRLAPDLGE